MDDRSDVGRATDLSFTDDFPPVSTEAWSSKIESDLRGKPIEKLNWHSIDGVTLRPFYRQEDLNALAHLQDGLLPLLPQDEASHPPSTRSSGDRETPNHVEGTGHDSAGNRWQIRQDVMASTPAAAAEQATEALEGGADAVGFVLAAAGSPAQAQGSGIPLSSPKDAHALLDGIHLNAAPVHFDGRPGTVVPALIAQEVAALMEEAQATVGSVVGGTITFDPIAALGAGSISDAEHAFDLAASTIQHTRDTGVRALAVDTRVYHEAGASAVQELAFAMNALVETLDQLTERGLDLRALVDALHVVVSVDTSYFIEIGKLRALRLLAARVINTFLDASRANDSNSGTNGRADARDTETILPADVYVQAHTSSRSQTLYAPYVNMLRRSTEAASAVTGGCDVLTVAPFDGAFRDPTEFSHRMARNTQLILRHESHLDQVADPGAGSYYIEAVTSELMNGAWSLFQEIEAAGGMLSALRDGTISERIDAVQDERSRRLDQRKHAFVGTSHYPDTGETRLADLEKPHAPGGEAATGHPEANRRSTPDGPALDAMPDEATLADLTEPMDNGRPMADVVAAFAAGESGISPLRPQRLSEPYESLRLATEQFAERSGRRPQVLLAPYGPAGARSARANFARNFLGVAGFGVIEPISFDSAEEAAASAIDDGADVVVACSSDDAYTEYVPSLRAALDAVDSRALLVVAGSPDRLAKPVTESADRFVHLKAPLLQTLTEIQDDLGITSRPG